MTTTATPLNACKNVISITPKRGNIKFHANINIAAVIAHIIPIKIIAKHPTIKFSIIFNSIHIFFIVSQTLVSSPS